MSFPCRVILLLDLDCFYAQCERVRLGLPPDTSLALLQWDSVLAVTYPAREAFKIKRGDSWDDIHRKSNGGQCLALHLPILTKEDATRTYSDADTTNEEEEESIEDSYQRVYCLSPQEQEAIRKKEVGVRRYAHEGKACLERYRIASSRIFAVVVETLQKQLGRDMFTLERASIDELFLDVTKYCWENEHVVDTSNVMSKTVHAGKCPRRQDESSEASNDDDNDDVRIRQALERGCVVAHGIRKAVFDTLGFTLSAGISTSKLVAKLGASYGKPNGQAVILPSAIQHVMDETEIRKVRNFGGKVGKQVQALLPPEEVTMGSIARLLSLPVLCEKLGPATGRAVFDACRGVDEELVKETIGALVKSITAFKSFQKTSISSGEVTEWIALLATDVVARVQRDAVRNNRYPKSCNIQYTCSKETLPEHTGRVTRSVRIPFPRDGNVKAKLVQQAKDAVYAKEGKVFLYRFGLCAVDFKTKMANGGISSFFSKGADSPAARQVLGETTSSEKQTEACVASEARRKQDEEIARKLQAQCDANLETAETSVVRTSPKIARGGPKATNDDDDDDDGDRDLLLAKKLQAQYDRENYVLSTAEKRTVRKPNSHTSSSKKQRIDSFFTKS